MKPTHAVTLSGRITFGLVDTDYETHEEEIGHYLRMLDGVKRFSVVLWKIPDGMEFSDVNLGEYPKEYIQTAGSPERMAVEIRRQNSDGEPRQFAIGHAVEDEIPERSEIVSWSTHEVIVQGNEVLDVEEVVALFSHYYRHGEVSSNYSQRELDL
jgi:hypothetical protein